MNKTWKHTLFAIVAYMGVSALIYWIWQTAGTPFLEHQPLVADKLTASRFWDFQTSALWIAIEIGIIFLLTLKYKDRRLQAPEKNTAKTEIAFLLVYMLIIQIFGLVLGRWLGFHAISFHLAGTLYGTHEHVGLPEMLVWAGYNFIFYVILPVFYLSKRKKYTFVQLNLVSNKNVLRDLLVIIVILVVESAAQLEGVSDAVLHLSPSQIALGGLTAFSFNLFGTALPTAVFIFALLFPRYKVISKSPVLPIVWGGLTYMAAHFFESWMVFGSVGGFLASLGALFLQYFLPGVVKSVLTDRTGNPWVHMWAYHAIAPHVIIDTPHFVEELNIK